MRFNRVWLSLLCLFLVACGSADSEAIKTINQPTIPPETAQEASIPTIVNEQFATPMPLKEDTQPVLSSSDIIERRRLSSLYDILRNPDTFIDHKVRVRGDANDRFGSTGLSITDNSLLDLHSLLIVNVPNGILTASTALMYAEPPLIVEGTVQILDLTNLDPSFGLEVTSELAPFNGRPMIVADSVIFDRTAVPFEEILADYDLFNGQEVTITGLFKRAVTNDSFEISHHAVAGLDSLVIASPNALGLANQLQPGQPIRIQGVLTFVDGEIRAPELEQTDLDDSFYDLLKGNILIVAEDIWPATLVETELAPILNMPTTWHGEQVVLNGELAPTTNDRVWTLSQGAYEIVVITLNPEVLAPDITAGDGVIVQGTVRPVNNATIKHDLGDIELDPDIFKHNRTAPVIIASSVRRP